MSRQPVKAVSSGENDKNGSAITFPRIRTARGSCFWLISAGRYNRTPEEIREDMTRLLAEPRFVPIADSRKPLTYADGSRLDMPRLPDAMAANEAALHMRPETPGGSSAEAPRRPERDPLRGEPFDATANDAESADPAVPETPTAPRPRPQTGQLRGSLCLPCNRH